MSPEVQLAGTQLVSLLLRRAIDVSSRIADGTLDQEYLDGLEEEDAAARERQIEARDRAKAEGR